MALEFFTGMLPTMLSQSPDPVTGVAGGAAGGAVAGAAFAGTSLAASGVTATGLLATAKAFGVGATALAVGSTMAPAILTGAGVCSALGLLHGTRNYIGRKEREKYEREQRITTSE